MDAEPARAAEEATDSQRVLVGSEMLRAVAGEVAGEANQMDWSPTRMDSLSPLQVRSVGNLSVPIDQLPAAVVVQVAQAVAVVVVV